jgi:hypothetical protein
VGATRERVEATAAKILPLAEQAQAIDEIIHFQDAYPYCRVGVTFVGKLS